MNLPQPGFPVSVSEKAFTPNLIFNTGKIKIFSRCNHSIQTGSHFEDGETSGEETENSKNEITFEVKDGSNYDDETIKYFLYRIQKGCEAVTYRFVDGDDETMMTDSVMCLLQIRDTDERTKRKPKKKETECETCVGGLSLRGEDGGWRLDEKQKSMLVSPSKGRKIGNTSCPVCLKVCKNKGELKRHLCREHEPLKDDLVCELCGEIFSNSHLFWKHKSVHSVSKSYEYDLCKKKFKSKRQIQGHIKTAKPIEDANMIKFVCDICKKSLIKEEYYKAHMKRHMGDLNFECDKCHKKFSSSIGLSIHNSHKGSCIQKCNECLKSFASNESVCDHLKDKKLRERKAKYVPRGLREKTKSCPICGKLFHFNSEVKLHVTISHTNEKKFVCEECGKCFKTQKCFQLHKRIHLDFRPYLCRFCEKRFRTLNHIKQHIRTHTGEKPYSCPVCNRGFAQNGDMKKHLLKIHDFTYNQIRL